MSLSKVWLIIIVLLLVASFSLDATVNAKTQSTYSSPNSILSDASANIHPVSNQNIELVGHLGVNYAIIALASKNSYVFISADPKLGQDPGMAVLDISNPSAPLQIGFVAFPAQVNHIYISGDYAFVYANELKVVNISDPTLPYETGSLPGIRIETIEGSLAYIHDTDYTLRVFNISNLSNPIEIGSYNYNGYQVAVMNSKFYTFDGNMLRIMDFSNPNSPTEIGTLPIQGKDLDVKGDYAYISWGDCTYGYYGCESCSGGIKVVDVSDAAQPFEIVPGLSSANVMQFEIHGDKAFTYTLGCWSSFRGEMYFRYFSVSDISNPSDAKYIGTIGNRYPADITVWDEYVAFAYNMEGMEIWDISSSNFGQIGSFGTSIPLYDVAVSGDYAYSVGKTRLRVVDISEPRLPFMIASWETDLEDGYANSIAISDDNIYFGFDNLYVVNVAEPNNPFFVGGVTDGGGENIAVVNGYAYITQNNHRWDASISNSQDLLHFNLLILDVTDPTTPTSVGTFGDRLSADVAIDGNQAFVSFRKCDDPCYSYIGAGLSIVDVADPANPIQLGSTDFESYSGENLFSLPIAVLDLPSLNKRYVYFGFLSELKVLDVSDPMSPVWIQSVPVGGEAKDMVISGEHLYLAADDGGLFVFDISNPAVPQQVGSFYTPYTTGVAVSDGYIYLANGTWGMTVVQYGYQISGRIMDTNYNGFTGVTLASSASITTTTNTNGEYTFVEQESGTYVITPTLSGNNFYPSSRTVTLPPDASGQNFTILPEPVSITLTPGSAVTLAYNDTQGLLTQLEFPPDAVTEVTTITLTPTLVIANMGSWFTGHAFDLAAFQDGPVPGFAFNTPVIVTIHYSDADVRVVSDESALALAWWNGNDWQDAASTCDPISPYICNELENIIQLGICSTGRFGLFGLTNQIILSLIFR